jgi:hypothetical protein
MTPKQGAEVVLTSGHTVVFLHLLADGRMRVRSKKMKIEFETAASRLPYFPW